MSFAVYPAVDLMGGKAVRLLGGRRETARVVAADPVALARRLDAEGAQFMHVVDLDGAFGDGDSAVLIGRMITAVRCPVQVGGGLRDRDSCARMRAAGAARLVLGTAAVRAPDLLAELIEADPEGVVVAADARAGRVTVDGWREDGGEPLEPFAERMRSSGVRRLLVTAVERDGAGAGPDHGVLGRAVTAFGSGVIASGGVGSIADVYDLLPLVRRGLSGVVVGSLLVDGRATVSDLVAAVAAWDGDL